jgi:hypothetical protein
VGKRFAFALRIGPDPFAPVYGVRKLPMNSDDESKEANPGTEGSSGSSPVPPVCANKYDKDASAVVIIPVTHNKEINTGFVRKGISIFNVLRNYG